MELYMSSARSIFGQRLLLIPRKRNPGDFSFWFLFSLLSCVLTNLKLITFLCLHRTPFEFTDGDEKRTSFSSFTSTITLRIPNRGAVMYAGEARPDKKSSFDSAVVELLYELERRKIVTIQK